jgi:hypothetical protein
MEMPIETKTTIESFVNDDVKAYLDSLTPAKSGPEWDCECRECGEEINDQCQGYCDPRRGHKCICLDCFDEQESDSDEEESDDEEEGHCGRCGEANGKTGELKLDLCGPCDEKECPRGPTYADKEKEEETEEEETEEEECPGCLRPKTDEEYREVRCCRCDEEMCDQCYSVSPIEGDDECYCKRCGPEECDSDEEEEEILCDCSTCGKGLTSADVDAIPPEMFDETSRYCAGCCADEEEKQADRDWETMTPAEYSAKWTADRVQAMKKRLWEARVKEE